MKRILNQSHPKEAFLFAISRFLERTSFYGLRALIMLYMVTGILNMENSEALSIYGWFTTILVFSKVLGAIIGDLLIGNKKAIIIGGITQTMGAISLCIPTTSGLYVGLFLVVLGGGLYSPNLISNYGKTYLKTPKLLDAGFTLFYLVINLGAFIGIVSLGYIGEKYGWNIGFLLAALLMLLSIIPILFTRVENNNILTYNKIKIKKRIVNISIVLGLVSLFWAFYEIEFIRSSDLKSVFIDMDSLNIPKSLWTSIESIFVLPLSIIAVILWTFFYSNQFYKLVMGFIFGALSFGMLIFIPEIPTEYHITLFFASIFFLNISEIHIAPVVNSIFTQYANPKYLAILISLAFLPTRLFSIIIFNNVSLIYDNLVLAVKVGFVLIIIACTSLIAFLNWRNKTESY